MTDPITRSSVAKFRADDPCVLDGVEGVGAGPSNADHAACVGSVTADEVDVTRWCDRAAIAADAGRLPARRGLTARGAARFERRTVTRLLDERLSFEVLGSLTDRARLRDRVLADLAGSRQQRLAVARAHARSRGGWSR